MSSKSQPTDLTHRVVANVRRLRKMRGWSARELEEHMAAAGCPVSRQVISNRETRQVSSRISVDELFAFAAVFDRPVTDLVQEVVQCERCGGSPPPGFICQMCGAKA